MVTSAGSCLLLCIGVTLVNGKLPPPGGPQRLQVEPIDSIKAVEAFENLVSITDLDNDTVFECLSAWRRDFDPDLRKVTYMWSFPLTGQLIPFTSTLGDEPGTFAVSIGGDPTKKEGIMYYTDYENCVILGMDYKVNYCALWTQREVKDAVPQNCIDHFVDTCGVIVPPHSRDLCPDGEGDY